MQAWLMSLLLVCDIMMVSQETGTRQCHPSATAGMRCEYSRIIENHLMMLFFSDFLFLIWQQRNPTNIHFRFGMTNLTHLCVLGKMSQCNMWFLVLSTQPFTTIYQLQLRHQCTSHSLHLSQPRIKSVIVAI